MKSFFTLAALVHIASTKTESTGCTSFTRAVTVRSEPGFCIAREPDLNHVSDILNICRGADWDADRIIPREVSGPPGNAGTGTSTASFLPYDPAASIEKVGATKIAITNTAIAFVHTRSRSFDEAQQDSSATSLRFLRPSETSNPDATLNPTKYGFLTGGNDEEILMSASRFPPIPSIITPVLSNIPIDIPCNATMTAIVPQHQSLTKPPTDAPSADTKPTAMALAINLMTGVAVLMAML
ncbi:hypothetical protein HJFPF1_05599 [Paramyrothecium foliicola]|nr:hypothetical protein HJFPF1_05599 [Paramyrothecium foliicola]